MFFISQGSCEVISPARVVVFVFKEGGYFGETALLKESKRTATVRAGSYCDLQVLSSDCFMDVTIEFPTSAQYIVNAMEAKIAQYTKQNSTATVKKGDSGRKKSIEQAKQNAFPLPGGGALGSRLRRVSIGSLGVSTIRAKDIGTLSPLHSKSLMRTIVKDFEWIKSKTTKVAKVQPAIEEKSVLSEALPPGASIRRPSTARGKDLDISMHRSSTSRGEHPEPITSDGTIVLATVHDTVVTPFPTVQDAHTREIVEALPPPQSLDVAAPKTSKVSNLDRHEGGNEVRLESFLYGSTNGDSTATVQNSKHKCNTDAKEDSDASSSCQSNNAVSKGDQEQDDSRSDASDTDSSDTDSDCSHVSEESPPVYLPQDDIMQLIDIVNVKFKTMGIKWEYELQEMQARYMRKLDQQKEELRAQYATTAQ
jgi:hypothetical protein